MLRLAEVVGMVEAKAFKSELETGDGTSVMVSSRSRAASQAITIVEEGSASYGDDR